MLEFKSLYKFVFMFLLSTLIAACQTTTAQHETPTPKATSTPSTEVSQTITKSLNPHDITVGKVIAVKSEQKVILGAKGAELENIIAATQDAVSKKLSGLNGSKVVDVKIHVVQYHIGFGSPVFKTKFELLSPETGDSLSPLKRSFISQGHFDGGNLFIVSPFATPFDREYPAMIGLYARKFEERLNRFLSKNSNEIKL